MKPLWRIELLGRLCLSRDACEVSHFRTRRTAALLAYLAYHAARPHARDELMDVCWPSLPSQTAHNGLRVALNSLRQQLEPGGIPAGMVLVADRHHVQIAPDHISTDVAAFESALHQGAQARDEEQAAFLTVAVEAYGGDLLPGFEETWVASERHRLSDAYLGALRRLTRCMAQARDFDHALDYARRVVQVDPLREESHRTLMRLYAAVGRPAAVRNQYRELEQLLKEGLETVPSPATRDLFHELVAGAAPAAMALPSVPIAPVAEPPSRSDVPSHSAEPSSSASSETCRSCPAPVGNLPSQFTRFFGRQAEIAELQALLGNPEIRMVTLTGTGGTGKTRLALEAAARLQARFDDIWLAECADIVDPRHLATEILKAMRLQPSPQEAPLETLAQALTSRRTLLVIDNMEHLLSFIGEKAGASGTGGVPGNGTGMAKTDGDGEAQAFVRALLHRVPTLTCLITSRQSLDVAGEQIFTLLPLPLPLRSMSRTRLQACPSVQLFEDRARAVHSRFRLTERNADAIAALCARLDGLPLALELAAAWAAVLTPSQMLARMQQRLNVPASTHQDVAARHRTLRAAIAWSYDLLTPELQLCFARLSVFRGEWTLDAAESILQNPAMPTLLRHLQARSLTCLRDTHFEGEPGKEASGQSETEEEMRFCLLETLREFAAERLEAGDREDLSRRHAEYFLHLAEEADAHLAGPEQALWLTRLEREHDNLRAALDWSLATCSADLALRLVGALHQFWRMRGHLLEGRERLTQVLALPGAHERTTARARALNGAWMLAWHHGDLNEAYARLEEGVSIAREIANPTALATLLNNLGNLAFCRNDLADARALYAESLLLRRELGDRPGMASPLNNLGEIARDEHDYHTAHLRFEESLAIWRESGWREGIAGALHNLGNLALVQDDLPCAETRLIASLTIRGELRDRFGITQSLEELAELAYRKAEFARAVCLRATVAMLRDQIGDLLTPTPAEQEENSLPRLRADLGEHLFNTAWAQGWNMTLEEALAYALSANSP